MKDESRKELDEIRELLRMAAVQTAATAKGLDRHAEQFAHDLKASRDEHDREMKEIRAQFKKMLERIAV